MLIPFLITAIIVFIVLLALFITLGNKSINTNHDDNKERENIQKFKNLNELENDLKDKGFSEKEIKKRRKYADNHYKTTSNGDLSPALIALLMATNFDNNSQNDINLNHDNNKHDNNSHVDNSQNDNSHIDNSHIDNSHIDNSHIDNSHIDNSHIDTGSIDSGSSFSNSGSFGGDSGGSF